MVDYFTGERPWRQFFDFLDELPSYGHYKSAMVMDQEWARRVLDMRAEGEDVTPAADPDLITPRGYSPEIAHLAEIADRLLLVRNAIIATAGEGSDEPSFEPLPRPVTALDAERERRVRNELLDVDRMIRGV